MWGDDGREPIQLDKWGKATREGERERERRREVNNCSLLASLLAQQRAGGCAAAMP